MLQYWLLEFFAFTECRVIYLWRFGGRNGRYWSTAHIQAPVSCFVYMPDGQCLALVDLAILGGAGTRGPSRPDCLYYRPQTKFAKVTFSRVSVCPQGDVFASGPGSGWQTPLRQTPPSGHPLPGRYPTSGQTPPRRQTVNKRAVHIPLECILVFIQFFKNFSLMIVGRPATPPGLTPPPGKSWIRHCNRSVGRW